MSTQESQFKQSPHKLLSVPGPVEVSDEVLFAVRRSLFASSSTSSLLPAASSSSTRSALEAAQAQRVVQDSDG